MDNGSSHRGQPCVRRLTQGFPNLVPVHGPVHASWLNQIEIYFSIVQRKALTPNDFSCIEEVADRLLRFQDTTSAWLRPSTGDSPSRPRKVDQKFPTEPSYCLLLLDFIRCRIYEPDY